MADLAILAPVEPVTPPPLALLAATTPHLEVTLRETTAFVGPLVLPGQTPCRRCAELHRADRDPEWPWLAAQLAVSPPDGAIDASDTTLAALAAALAAAHALRWIDAREPDHPLLGSISETSLLDLATRRRSVPAHPHCPCDAGLQSQAA